MRILVIGDFHGKFPDKISKAIKKNKPDLIISLGDYLPFHYRKLWFKHCYAKEVQLWEIIGKQKYKKLILKDINLGEKTAKKLNNFGIPVLTVLGNIDHPYADDIKDEKKPTGKKYWAWEYKREAQFNTKLKKFKNIKRIDYLYSKFGDLIFIGARGHSFPGRVKSKAYRKHKLILEKLFKKFGKENRNRKVIFVSHNVPYKTRLDIIRSKKAHHLVRRQHYGSKLVRRIVKEFQPVLAIGGHVHESFGMQKIGKTLVVNPGAVYNGKYAIVDYLDGKVKVRFIN